MNPTVVLAVAIALATAGCRSNMWDTSPMPEASPVYQMMARSARGEVVCVRMGVVVEGRANCR